MPLEAPNLDDRLYDQIYQEARRRIPIYNPEWTDYNDSDPGITLLQLFSWLTESIIYRLNRVPERSYIKFLQLLGMELRPAQPAHAHLVFSAEPSQGPLSVPRRTQVTAQPPDGSDTLTFETLEGIDLVPLVLGNIQIYDGSFHDLSSANATPGTGFWPFGWLPQINHALYLGFEPPDPLPTTRIFPSKISLRAFLPSEATAGVAQSAEEVRYPPAPPVTLTWEYRPREGARWRKLNLFKDDSAAFTREGYLAIEGPDEIQPTQIGLVEEPRYWIRCRLAGGTYPSGTVPKLDFIRANVVEAENLATLTDELLGVSEGTPSQVFTLAKTPVERDSLALNVLLDGVETKWTLVDDFLAANPESTVYTLNPASGQIRFGDGRRGQIPGAGGEIIAASYRYGGASAGNVPPGAINSTGLAGVSSVTNPRPATGGQDEQALEELKEQAPTRLRSRDRAVTAEDFNAIAAQAGGVAKVTTLPMINPYHPGVEVPGAVTLVILPDIKEKAPVPSSDLIRSVLQYLEPFRLLTTELYVKGPVYKAIQVEAAIAANPFAAFDTVKQEVSKALDDALSPFHRDFGADLYPTSFYSIILNVKDVRAVTSLTVYVNGRAHEDITRAITLDKDELVYGAEHSISMGPYEEH